MTDERVEFDPLTLRRILGQFATGVTVITPMDGDEPVGLAANSFTSVSLKPPLVLAPTFLYLVPALVLSVGLALALREIPLRSQVRSH